MITLKRVYVASNTFVSLVVNGLEIKLLYNESSIDGYLYRGPTVVRACDF